MRHPLFEVSCRNFDSLDSETNLTSVVLYGYLINTVLYCTHYSSKCSLLSKVLGFDEHIIIDHKLG